MLDAGILVPCDMPTEWYTKVIKANCADIHLVGDFRGLNAMLKKLLWHTESLYQLIPPDAKVFAVIDTTSWFH